VSLEFTLLANESVFSFFEYLFSLEIFFCPFVFQGNITHVVVAVAAYDVVY
jgi:hypothetical protein